MATIRSAQMQMRTSARSGTALPLRAVPNASRSRSALAVRAFRDEENRSSGYTSTLTTPNQTQITSQTRLEGTLDDLQARWNSTSPKDKKTTAAAGVAALVTGWLASVALDAADTIPLFPRFLQFVGLLSAAQFYWKYVMFKRGRDALRTKFSQAYNGLQEIVEGNNGGAAASSWSGSSSEMRADAWSWGKEAGKQLRMSPVTKATGGEGESISPAGAADVARNKMADKDNEINTGDTGNATPDVAGAGSDARTLPHGSQTAKEANNSSDIGADAGDEKVQDDLDKAARSSLAGRYTGGVIDDDQAPGAKSGMNQATYHDKDSKNL